MESMRNVVIQVAATVGAIAAGRSLLQLLFRYTAAQKQIREACFDRILFFDRKSSNNSARIRLWMYMTGLEKELRCQSVSHDQQHSDAFRSINPFEKVPAMIIFEQGLGADSHVAASFKAGDWDTSCANATNARWLAEAAVIAEFLEDLRLLQNPALDCKFIPSPPELRAHMNLVIRCHDLYLASPNCTQPGPFTHTQACMYVPPPGACASASRWVERSVRAAKLAECWKQLDNLENLLLGPFFCGAMMSLADFAVFPTIVFMEFYMPRVFAWSESALFHDRPRLCAWYTVHMSSLPAASRVRDELVDSMLAKEATGLLKAIIAETKDETYKWKYP